MYAGDSLISSTPVTLHPGESRASLTYTPLQEGLQQYTVTVTPLDGEATTRNNRATFTTRVVQRNQQIMLLAASPHPDLATIRSILTQGEGRSISTFVQKDANTFYESARLAPLDTCDLIIMVGYPGLGAAQRDIDQITTIARAGTPLLFVLSTQTDLERLRIDFAGILPAIPQRTQMQFDEAAFTPTPAGLRHPVLDFPEPEWNTLPPLTFGTGRWNLTPDTQILGQASIRGVNLQAPFLVVRNRNGYRSAALLGAGSWRWLNLTQDPIATPRLWPQLLENLVQWLTAPDDNQPVRITPVASTFDRNESVLFTGQVYDESLRPVSEANVILDIIAPDGSQYPYTMQNAGNGRYRLSLETMPEGVYEYTARATRLGGHLGSDSGTFTVGIVGLEYRETRTNATLLRQIALRSGGQFFTPQTLHTLPSVLAADSLFSVKISSNTVDRALWQWPAMMIVVLVLLSTEWILRKRSGLV